MCQSRMDCEGMGLSAGGLWVGGEPWRVGLVTFSGCPGEGG